MLNWLKRSSPAATAAPADAALEAALAESRRLQETGNLVAALAVAEAALQRHPRDPRVVMRLGTLLLMQQHFDEAERHYRRGLELDPANADWHYNLALVHGGRGDNARSIESYRCALALDPGHRDAHFNLATELHEIDELDEAIDHYMAADAIEPGHRDVLTGAGLAMLELDRLDEACACFERILAHHPEHPEARLYRGLARLKLGDYEHGWDDYEFRLDTEEIRGMRRYYPGEAWNGEDVTGRTVLLVAEQGFGDAIQFVRFAPLLMARGARVMLEAPRPLVSLLRTIPGLEVILRDDPLPRYDYYAYLMSLPRFFARSLEAIPARVPYLTPAAEKVAAWKQRLAGDRNLRVGLVWAGDPHKNHPQRYRADRRRSAPLPRLAGLGTVPGVTWYSLQKGDAAEQARGANAPFPIVDLTDELESFEDTAALIEALDLVVAVDTAVGHLAGALAKPTWSMLRYDCCWRWLKDRTDSPWYPHTRLYRQPERFAWEEVVEAVARDLAALAATR
ncbi:MAG: tetratricopeptide repeat protein [Burkholderiales bacterium]|nr:tetratricopeptide repeat protein [Burkholderiales bacterium]